MGCFLSHTRDPFIHKRFNYNNKTLKLHVLRQEGKYVQDTKCFLTSKTKLQILWKYPDLKTKRTENLIFFYDESLYGNRKNITTNLRKIIYEINL